MGSRAILKMGNIAPPILRHIARADYQTKPWKNGKGTTHDILILPEGSNHDSFDLRFALSPIVETAVFSSFPGADRVITVVEGEGLDLQFQTQIEHLSQYQSHYFDTGLDPIGTPLTGPVRVINVMARRGVWDIAECKMTSALNLDCDRDNMLFVYCVGRGCSINVDGAQCEVGQSNAFLVSNASRTTISGDGMFLYAHLKPSA
jgi:uncharacterized protein